jgi:hypothetical protein
VDFNPEENSCLNACVILRSENIAATPDPLLSLAMLRDEQRLSLGSSLTVVIIPYKSPIKLEIKHENDHQHRLRGLN